MVQLSKLKLHDLSEMVKREQNLLRGGTCGCITGCPCAYAGTKAGPADSYYGGSSTDANGEANINMVASNVHG